MCTFFCQKMTISGRKRMTVENIHERMLPTRLESTSQPPNHQSEAHRTEPPRLEKGKINHIVLFFFYTIYSKPLLVYTTFEDSSCHRTREICDETFYGNEKCMNKGNDKHEDVDSLLYNAFLPNACSKFQNPRCSSSWEVFDINFPMQYIGVRDVKKGEKDGKINQYKFQHRGLFSWFCVFFVSKSNTCLLLFLLHNILQPSILVNRTED